MIYEINNRDKVINGSGNMNKNKNIDIFSLENMGDLYYTNWNTLGEGFNCD